MQTKASVKVHMYTNTSTYPHWLYIACISIWLKSVHTFHDPSFTTRGINLLSKTWEKGPWPRSWQRPAICTHSISFLLIFSHGCLRCNAVTSWPARWQTLHKTYIYPQILKLQTHILLRNVQMWHHYDLYLSSSVLICSLLLTANKSYIKYHCLKSLLQKRWWISKLDTPAHTSIRQSPLSKHCQLFFKKKNWIWCLSI